MKIYGRECVNHAHRNIIRLGVHSYDLTMLAAKVLPYYQGFGESLMYEADKGTQRV